MAKFFEIPANTVDGILRDFHKTVEKLEKLVSDNDATVEYNNRKIRELAIDNELANAESLRAKNVAGKLKDILG